MSEFTCLICIKNYKNKRSIQTHKNKFHKGPEFVLYMGKIHNRVDIEDVIQTSSKRHPNVIQNLEKNYKCDYCHKMYKYRQGKSKHMKNCKMKTDVKEINNEIVEMKKLIKSNFDKQINIKNELNLNNSNINITNTHNTINIVPFGYEEPGPILSDEEQILILKSKYNSLIKLVDIMHFNKKYPQFNNLAITNCQNNIAYVYNKDDSSFNAVDENEMLNDLINYRASNIYDFIEFQEDNISARDKKALYQFLKMLLGDDEEGIDKDLFKDNIKKLRMLIYNKSKNIKIN